MNIQTERNDNHQAVLTVELDSDQLEKKKQQAARKLARSTNIPGFRPGKAPYPMVLRHVGEGRVLEDAVEALIDEVYPKVIEESGIKPYGSGKLEHLHIEETPIKAQFIVPLAPEVTIGDYKSIRIDYQTPTITDEQVEKAIQSAREMYAQVEKVDRPAEENDLVNISLSGKIEGAAEEEKPYIDDESFPVIIEAESADTSNEWPFPGFSRTLIGVSEDDTKTVSFSYPEDYTDEEGDDSVNLAGKTVHFDIAVSRVSLRTLPELNEEFFKRLGSYETMGDAENGFRTQLAETSLNEYEAHYEDHIIDELLKIAEIKYPPEAVEDEIDVLYNRLKNRLESQGIDMDVYLRVRQLEENQLRDELREMAENRLKQSLVLMQIAEQENIQVNQDAVQHELEETVNTLFSNMTQKEARRSMNDNVLRGLAFNIFNNILLSNTVKHLRTIARGEFEEQPQEETLSEETSAESQVEPEPTTEVPEAPPVEPENSDPLAESSTENE